MAFVTDYTCSSCGLELTDDGRVFIWDEDSNQVRDFLILMSTCHLLNGAKISGNVNETYCRECGRYLKIYSITQSSQDISNPCEVIEKGIKKHIEEFGSELERLKEIRRKSQYSIEKEDNHYVVRIPEYESFYYSNYLFPHMTREEVIEDALNDFHEEIDELIEVRERAYRRYLDSNYLVVDERDRPDGEFNPKEMVECPVCGSQISRYVGHEIPCPRCGGQLSGFGVCYD